MNRAPKRSFFAPALGQALLLCAFALLTAQSVPVRAGTPHAADAAPRITAASRQYHEAFAAAAEYSARRNGSALVVMSGGEVIFSAYAHGAGPQVPHRLASGTKSFWGVLAMAAVEDGLFTLDEHVADTLTEWQGDPQKSRIRVRHLLNFTSGLARGTRLLRGHLKSRNTFELVIGLPSIDAPGSSFAYGPSHLVAFGAFLQRKLRAAGQPGDPVSYLERRILDPIGLEVAHWRKDAAGNPTMPAGAHVAPLEWAKFGKLLKNKGAWEGRQIVDSKLIARVFQGSDANPAYGLTLWLNHDARGGEDRPEGQGRAAQRISNSDDGYIYPDLPRDVVMAAGAGKQRLYVIPSEDLVIVRQGESRGTGWSDPAFLALVLTALGR